MKKLFYLSILLTFSTLVSCDEEKPGLEDYGSPVNSASEIQGTWESYITGFTTTITFSGNSFKEEQVSTSSGNVTRNSGTFSIKNSKITFKYDGGYMHDYTVVIRFYTPTQLNIGKFAYHKVN